MASLVGLEDVDLYGFMGVSSDANEAALKKAYRKKALELHPDQNREDPFAADKFNKLKKIFEVLKDEKLREEYDRKLKGRLEAKRKREKEDAFLKAMRDKLESREAEASKVFQQKKQKTEVEQTKQDNLELIAKLKQEGKLRSALSNTDLLMAKKEREALEKSYSQLSENKDDLSSSLSTVVVKWGKDRQYSEADLRRLFDVCGSIASLMLNAKKRKCFIVFANAHAAENAVSDQQSIDSKLQVSAVQSKAKADQEISEVKGKSSESSAETSNAAFSFTYPEPATSSASYSSGPSGRRPLFAGAPSPSPPKDNANLDSYEEDTLARLLQLAKQKKAQTS